jgi:alpha-beta hydrolase superfamily lysophospholipase
MEINGVSLFVKENNIKDSKGVVIITHGIAEHSSRYDYFVKKLNESSYDVFTYDLRGHGRSGGDKGKVDSFKDFINDLHEIVKYLAPKYTNIFLFGHSMGGEIVNLYNATYDDCMAIVSSAASTNTPIDANILKFLPKFLIKGIKKKTSFGDTLTHNQEIVNAYNNDPLVLRYFYGSLAYEMFIKGIKYLNKNINNMKTPILFLHGEMDLIVSPKFSQILYDKIPISDKNIIIYQNSRHEILNEESKDLVILDVINWFDSHIK